MDLSLSDLDLGGRDGVIGGTAVAVQYAAMALPLSYRYRTSPCEGMPIEHVLSNMLPVMRMRTLGGILV